MLSINNFVRVLALSTVMFGTGATVATVVLSYLPIVNATPTKVAQGLKQSKPEAIDEEGGLKFQLQDCKRGIKTVVCNVTATNLSDKNRTLQFNASQGNTSTRGIDFSGNEYVAKKIQIGQEQGNDWLVRSLIGGIPTKLSFSFEMPKEVTKLAVIEVNYLFGAPPEVGGDARQIRKVQIRDVDISVSQASNPANPGTKCTCPTQTNPKKPRAR
jgi:hypothetical protein